MAYPTLDDTAESEVGVSAPPWDVDLPALETGDLVVVYVAVFVANADIGTPSGWTEEDSYENSNHYVAVFSRVIDGTEGYTGDGTDTLAIPSTAFDARVLCVAHTYSKPVDLATLPIAALVTTGNNPPPVNATGEALYIAVQAIDGIGSNPITGYPSGMSLHQQTLTHSEDDELEFAICGIESDAGSYNPGSFTATGQYPICGTVAIRALEGPVGGGFGGFG